MACCGGGSCGGSGGYGGYGGYGGHGGGGAGAGGGGVLVDTGRTSDVHVQPGGCSLTVPGPRLVCHCDTRVSCHCVCAEECCAATCCGCGSGGYGGYGGGRGGAGNHGPGMRVDMRYPSYDVILPGAFLCSTAHCGHVDCCESCCDPCCGPC